MASATRTFLPRVESGFTPPTVAVPMLLLVILALAVSGTAFGASRLPRKGAEVLAGWHELNSRKPERRDSEVPPPEASVPEVQPSQAPVLNVRPLVPPLTDSRSVPVPEPQLRFLEVPVSDAPIQIQVGPKMGWKRVFVMSNGLVEAVVVPDIGRVMDFRFAGETGPFWEDPSLHGQPTDPESGEWLNFGGDKSWPAPQADWPEVTGREWPPPVAFDAMPVEVSVRRDALVLRGAVDPHYGIRVERMIEMEHSSPRMRIITTYEKVEGPPQEVSVWIITQLKDPIAVFAPIPVDTLFRGGFTRQTGEKIPADLKREGDLLSLRREPLHPTKIGLDADRLLWVGTDQMLLIESPRSSERSYPDYECSSEIYTNPDPKAYVELEMLGPLQLLSVGDTLSQTNTYTLLRRQHPNPDEDARHALGIENSQP